MTTNPTVELPERIEVVNIGLPMFADAVREQGVPVVGVDWRPPADGRLDVVRALRVLYADPSIERANAEVVRRLDTGAPQLRTVSPAGAVVPGLTGRMLLHCGPAITWDRVCDPLRRSMRAAVVAEGWASDVAGADELLATGAIALSPANDHDTVVPMASAIGPGTPVLVVEHRGDGDGRTWRAFAPLNQGPGETPWFGRDTDAAIERLRLLRDVGGPAVAAVLHEAGPLDVLALAAQGVAMGDDVHMRVQATTNLLTRTWLAHIAALPDGLREPFAGYLAGNHLFCLTLAMAAAKSLQMWADEVPGSTIVTSMSRNGTDYAVRTAGASSRQSAAAPPVGEALYYSGYGPEDAAPDIGDSAVLELTGLGGPAAGNSPSVAAFLGGRMADAAAATEAFRQICAGTSSRFILPAMGFAGTPIGVDARLVVETGVTPKVTTGILHAHAGVGQIGAGVATAPLSCFVDAVLALAAERG